MNTKCQVFTPDNYVEELLNSIGYNQNITGKKILENSCGDGNILSVIVQRYIFDCRSRNICDNDIINGLKKDIYGVEIDPEQHKKCIKKLNGILKKEGLKKINWKVYKNDYLNLILETKFDYIVGNPPYITYKELTLEQRYFAKINFESCKHGKFDYCYAFIEKSINDLAKDGKLAYLIPSSIFKTVFGKELRKLMIRYIFEIKDYTTEHLFDNALVKSSIILLNKTKDDQNLKYIDMSCNHVLNIPLETLSDKWFFTNNINNGTKKFGDFFQVSHVVATLLNEAFVIKNWVDKGNFIECGKYRIEKKVLRNTATPRTLKNGKEELIIFPYEYRNNILVKYSLIEFEKKFPLATEYLKTHREKLDKRKKDSSAKWFEYGRSQALAGLNVEKLLISTVITEKVKVYLLNKDCIPYSGMYIVPKTEQFDLNYVKTLLESRDFLQYVLDVGIHISGNSLRITSQDIMNYRF